MDVVVTGGAGYLGCLLVPELLERGHRIRLFDRLSYGREVLSGFASSPNCKVIQGDVRRLHEFPELLEGAEAVIHLAGLANEPSCELDPDMTFDVNVESTREIANRAVQHDVRRFVLASSCAVYGLGVPGWLDEESPAEPVSVYGRSMLEAEESLKSVGGPHFEPVVARLATLYGWSPRMRFDLAINQMVASASKKGLVRILGGGQQRRPFLHVRDAARAIADLVEAPGETVNGEIVNIGVDDGNLAIGELGERVAAHLGDVSIEFVLSEVDRRRHDVHFGKLREVLRFEPEHSVDDGIAELDEKLKENKIDPNEDRYYNVRWLQKLLDTPVEEGGEPIAPRFIPLAKPQIGIEEERAVIETLRSGWLTSGPHVTAFEKAFAATVGAQHVVALISCTAALHLTLVHLGVKPGDEVITSPLTYGSVGNALVNMGVKVVFADIEENTLNIDPDSIARKITGKTKVIMPVHMTGEPCDLDAVFALGAKHNLPVIEDAAHALGARYKGTLIGGCGEYACFSFYAIKNITTIEGGVIALQDGGVAERLRRLAAHGMSATAWERYGRSAVPSPPEVLEPGYKYQMGNVNAAMGLEQLKKFPRFQETRHRLAGLYYEGLGDLDEIVFPSVVDKGGHAWHLMVIRLRLDALTKSRDDIAYALRQENVGTGFHFLGLHLHEYYRDVLGMKPEDLPNATAASREVLSLPLHPGMKDKDVYDVVAALKKVIRHARKRS